MKHLSASERATSAEDFLPSNCVEALPLMQAKPTPDSLCLGMAEKVTFTEALRHLQATVATFVKTLLLKMSYISMWDLNLGLILPLLE